MADGTGHLHEDTFLWQFPSAYVQSPSAYRHDNTQVPFVRTGGFFMIMLFQSLSLSKGKGHPTIGQGGPRGSG